MQCNAGLRLLSGVTLALLIVLQGAAVAADSYEPDDTASQARQIPTDGTAQTHEIQPANDVDYVRFAAQAGDRCVIETLSVPSNALEDTVVTLFSSDGATFIAEDDDGGDNLLSRLEYTFTSAGTYYARVRSYAASYTGGYRLAVRVTRQAIISGTVTRGGVAAEGVAVWARPVIGGFDQAAGIALTRADGSYAIPVEEGTYAVSAHLAGTLATPASRQVTVPGGEVADFHLATAPAPVADGVQTCRAVLVGIADYAGSGSDLSYCDRDALDFGAMLAQGANWRAENITVVLNRDANRDAIWGALQRMATLADADDLCLFFFSGHGTTGPDLAPYDEGGGQDEYLVESDLENDIRDDELGAWVANLPTTRFMAVIASCYSGGMIKSAAATSNIKGFGAPEPAAVADGFAEDLRRAMERKRQISPLDLDDNGFGVVITAADFDETCQESPQLQHDVMVYYALEGMAGPADTNTDGWISAEELYSYANPRATSFNPSQHAQLYDSAPGAPFNFLDRNPSGEHIVTITAGPSGEPSSVLPGAQVSCTVSARDSLGDPVGYSWAATSGSFDDASSRTPTWTAPEDGFDGDHLVTITVTARSTEDPSASDAGSFVVTVLSGQSGDVHITDGPTATPTAVAPGETVACSVTAEDGASGGLAYDWEARNGAGARVGGFDDSSARQPTWTPPAGASGVFSLSVRVTSLADGDQFDTGAIQVRVGARRQHTFGPGAQMVGIPGAATGAMLGDILGATRASGWDAGAQQYTQGDWPAEVGAGCWVSFDGSTNASVICTPWSGDTFSWQFRRGWNIVALPWNASVALNGMTSAPAGAVAPLAWSYRDSRYDIVSGLPLQGVAERNLYAWRSYWLYAREDCTATLTRSANVAAATDDAGWAITLMARTASGTDAATVCGVSNAALVVPDVPPAEGTPDLSLEGPSGLLAANLRSGGASEYAWPLRVTAAPGEEVTVLCPDISAVPPRLRVVLEDRETGAATSLRAGAGYRFVAGEGPRRLVLRVEQRGGAVALSGVTAQQTAAGASVAFTLSAPADVSAEVLNIAGRVVRRLEEGRPEVAGTHILAWNMRSDTGSAVPAGRYLVRLTARAENGEVASVVAALSIAL